MEQYFLRMETDHPIHLVGKGSLVFVEDQPGVDFMVTDVEQNEDGSWTLQVERFDGDGPRHDLDDVLRELGIDPE